jgi:sugar/nucleoside kinase (ribokinase family)
VDTCGSGDAFAAGFLHAHLRGEGLKRACILGNALGAVVATQTGATAPVSTAEIQALLESRAPRNEDPGLKVFTVG